ncbi:MAG: hypothetical protein AAF653_20075, partial [Chloroflexota bacterium]
MSNLIQAVTIVALVMLTILADPNDWRNGIIYKSVYRPVQCAVQGISAENCARDQDVIAAIRFPSVGNGNSRKLCSTSSAGNPIRAGGAEDGSQDVDIWNSCLTGDDNAPTNSGPVVLDRIDAVDVGAANSGFFTLPVGNNLATSTWELVAYAPDSNNVRSVAFTLSEIDTNGDVINVIYANNEDSTKAANQSFEATDYAGVDLDEGQYRITAIPNSAPDGTGKSGDPVSATFGIDPPPFTEPTIDSFNIRNFDDGNAPTIGDDASYEYAIAGFNILVNALGDHESIEYTLTGPPSSYIRNAYTEFTPAPYWIFGMDDVNTTDPKAITDLPAGTYTLTARAKGTNPNTGEVVTSAPYARIFEIKAPSNAFRVLSLDLYDASSDNYLQTLIDVNDEATYQDRLANGITLTLSPDNDFVTFVANVDDNGPTQSVILRLTGPNVDVTGNESKNASEYALYGDIGTDLEGAFLEEGSYTLTASPYDDFG